MRVEVDYDLCQGHAVCESEAPEVFQVPRKGQCRVILERPPEELRPRVELAVRYCPTQALRIVEE